VVSETKPLTGFPTTPLKITPITASPEKYPQRCFKEKACRWCGSVFDPQGPSHHYCSEACRKEVNSDKHYKRRYGVGVRWVQEKLHEQNWKCAICRTVGFKMREDHVSGLNLDHDHVTGKARALLCHNCNRGLGLFQDNPDFLRAAANYLEGHNDP
jgi:hypothetical protein